MTDYHFIRYLWIKYDAVRHRTKRKLRFHLSLRLPFTIFVSRKQGSAHLDKNEIVIGRVVIPITHICLLLLWKK